MGDHDSQEKTIEVKVVVASLVTLLGGVTFAILNAVQDNPGVIAGWPAWLQFVTLAGLPPLLTFFAGYRTPSNRV